MEMFHDTPIGGAVIWESVLDHSAETETQIKSFGSEKGITTQLNTNPSQLQHMNSQIPITVISGTHVHRCLALFNHVIRKGL